MKLNYGVTKINLQAVLVTAFHQKSHFTNFATCFVDESDSSMHEGLVTFGPSIKPENYSILHLQDRVQQVHGFLKYRTCVARETGIFMAGAYR